MRNGRAAGNSAAKEGASPGHFQDGKPEVFSNYREEQVEVGEKLATIKAGAAVRVPVRF